MTPVRIVVNGDEHEVRAGSTVDELVTALAASRRGTAVAVNGEVVPRSAWATAALTDGDRVEVLTARQGG